MDENNMLLGALGLLLCSYVIVKKRRRIRRYKTRPINRRRNELGNFKYFLKMKAEDKDQFFKYTRMTVPIFEELLNMVKGRLSRGPRKDGICAEQRLAITLQYLSQGSSMQSLASAYHMGITSVHKIVHETNCVLWEVLSPLYLKSPSSEEEWQKISEGFFKYWNFPNCLGALDGKHIRIQTPAKSGSHNYKKDFSIVLMAACDTNYLFTLVDIGAYGSQSDGGIFRNSIFEQRFAQRDMNVPRPAIIKNTNFRMPFVMVADGAFPLKNYIMCPYPGKDLAVKKKIFNYRLSRARRTIENAFGILVARWQVLKGTINAQVENVDNIVKATVVLHNFCKIKLAEEAGANNLYCPPIYTDTGDEDNGLWRTEGEPLRSVGRIAANNASRENLELRDTLADYFVSPQGALPWQQARVTEGQEPHST